MNTDFLISNINALESWLESSKKSLVTLPLRLGGYVILVIFLIISNLIALMRWPFAAIKRLFSSSSIQSIEEEPVHADQETLQAILSSEKRVLVDFWAEWCGPCVMMNGTIQKLAKEKSGSCIVAKVNTMAHPGIAKDYIVKGLPTLILFENGKEIVRYAGALSYRELVTFVESRQPSEP